MRGHGHCRGGGGEEGVGEAKGGTMETEGGRNSGGEEGADLFWDQRSARKSGVQWMYAVRYLLEARF